MKKKPKVRRVMLSYKKSCHISMVIKTVWHIGGGAHRAPWSTTVNSEKDAHNPQVNWCLIRLQKQFNGGKVAFQQMWAQLDVRPQVTNTKPQPQILNKDYFKVDHRLKCVSVIFKEKYRKTILESGARLRVVRADPQSIKTWCTESQTDKGTSWKLETFATWKLVWRQWKDKVPPGRRYLPTPHPVQD